MIHIKTVLTLVFVFLLTFVQPADARIEVIKDECPIYVSSHAMSSQITQQNGFYTLHGTILGFASEKFPFEANFSSLTTFTSISMYKPDYISIVLADGTGQKYLGRSDFKPLFDSSGATVPYIIRWSVTFPDKGYYAFNIFADGKLVGYYPFYVWSK